MKSATIFIRSAMAAALVMSIPTLSAQGMSQMLASRATDSMTKMLKLSPDMAKQVGSINESFMSKLTAAKGDPKGMMNVFKGRDEALKKTLRPDQWKQVQGNRAERASEMQTEIMANQVGLDESQLDRVSQVNLDSAKQMQEANSLSGAAKTDKLKSIRSSKMDSLSSILSPDQMKNWQSFTQGVGKNLMSKGVGKASGLIGM